MKRQHPYWLALFALITMASLSLSACSPVAAPPEATTAAPEQTEAQALPTEPEQTEEQAQPTAPEQTEEQAQPTAPEEATQPPAAETPKEGGKLVIGITDEPPTMDTHKAAGDIVIYYLGAALIAKDPENNYVPWLATSWDLSPDGKVWTFKLREDVKFHDGTPLTADDFVWTYQRAVDPDIQSPLSGQMLASMEKVEAPDPYTLVITLKEPMAPFLDNLVAAGFLTPLSKAWVEKWGEDYATHPMSVGPYKLKEWVTGDHITLERNPDYVWQPAYAKHEGPYYIQEMEFRIIPEVATIVAGFEAGELDYSYGIEPQYVPRIEDTGNYEILTTSIAGASPSLPINVSKPPFDDLKVRQAFSYAIDRQVMIEVIQKGNATIQYGPLSPSTTGYWPGVEEIGYGYDPEKAKSLLAEAGWSDSDGDGILEKDGQPLELTVLTDAEWAKEAQMLKEQLKAVGVELTIEQGELGVVVEKIVGGDFTIAFIGYQWPNYDILWLLYHSKQDGILNLSHVNDPELDEILDKTRSETDMEKQQSWVQQAQQRIVEQAYAIWLYNPQTFYPLSKEVRGAFVSQKNNNLYLEDAWIQE